VELNMNARTYRKKPVEIEAIVFASPWKIVQEFAPEIRLIKQSGGCGIAFGIIPTPEGDIRANIGDMLIRGVDGVLYPCNPDVFEQMYEEVTK